MKRSQWQSKPRGNKYNSRKTWAHETHLHVEKHPQFFRSFAGQKAEADYKEQMFNSGWILFDSKAEAERYTHLKSLENSEKIAGLQTQVRMGLAVNDSFICDYFVDFLYYKGEQMIAEDVKGYATDTYKIKSKLFKALYPKILFLEVPVKSVWKDPCELIRRAA